MNKVKKKLAGSLNSKTSAVEKSFLFAFRGKQVWIDASLHTDSGDLNWTFRQSLWKSYLDEHSEKAIMNALAEQFQEYAKPKKKKKVRTRYDKDDLPKLKD